MFRHLFLRDHSQARQLASAFRDADARGKNVGSWVWTLYIDEGAEDLDETRKILSHTVNLREFTVMCDAPLSLFAPLQRCHSLRRLEAWIVPFSQGLIEQIGVFKTLHELKLLVYRGWHPNEIMAPLTDVPSWTFPLVHRLHWAYPPGETHDEAIFLSRCSFPSLEVFTLAACDPRPEEMLHFGRFLDAHPHIIHLEVHIEVDRLVEIMPFVRSPSAFLVSKSGECPGPAIAALLRPELEILVISGGSEERYGPLLTAIAGLDHTRLRLEEIRLIWIDSQQGGPPVEGAPESLRLRGYAHSLSERGITVFANAVEVVPLTSPSSRNVD